MGTKTITITFDDLISAIFGEDEDYPDYGTPAWEIRGSDLDFIVTIQEAEKIATQWGGELEDEWVDDVGNIILPLDTEVKYTMCADDVLDTSDNLKADFRCHFTDMEEYGICDGLIKKEYLEKWINNCLQECINYFNHFTVYGDWGRNVSEDVSEQAIFCNFKLEKEYKLIKLNPNWTEDEYFLEGFDNIERDSRIDTFIYW